MRRYRIGDRIDHAAVYHRGLKEFRSDRQAFPHPAGTGFEEFQSDPIQKRLMCCYFAKKIEFFHKSVRLLVKLQTLVTITSMSSAPQLLAAAKTATCVGSRMDLISACLLGSSYLANPLIGSADMSEVFTVAMKGFDCVTYIETVLAQAESTTRDAFADTLQRIRYVDGRIGWKQRNHYMTEWIRNNTRSGWVRPVVGLTGAVHKDRILSAVPGLPPRRMKFTCVPKRELAKGLTALMATGDLIFFVSTRKRLDVFHCGILVSTPSGLLLRHASRSHGEVVEQSLAEFLKVNRMAGVIVVRPAEQG